MAEKANGKYEIDLSHWLMKDKNTWMRTANGCSETGDESAMFPLVAKIVKRWPFEGDPSDPAVYDNLEIEQWSEVMTEVGAALTARFRKNQRNNA